MYIPATDGYIYIAVYVPSFTELLVYDTQITSARLDSIETDVQQAQAVAGYAMNTSMRYTLKNSIRRSYGPVAIGAKRSTSAYGQYGTHRINRAGLAYACKVGAAVRLGAPQMQPDACSGRGRGIVCAVDTSIIDDIIDETLSANYGDIAFVSSMFPT
jgi:hypothetical protein